MPTQPRKPPQYSAQVAEVRRKAGVIKRAFSTPDGQEALQILIDQFGGSCYAKGDPYHTAYLEGGRDVLIYLRQNLNAKENDDAA